MERNRFYCGKVELIVFCFVATIPSIEGPLSDVGHITELKIYVSKGVPVSCGKRSEYV